MYNITIFTIGQWRFAVREEDLFMVANSEKQPVGGWCKNIIKDKLKDIKAINELNNNQFFSYIYFKESDIIHCLGVDSVSYPKRCNLEDLFIFRNNIDDDGIIGLFTENKDIISIIDLGKLFRKWISTMELIKI